MANLIFTYLNIFVFNPVKKLMKHHIVTFELLQTTQKNVVLFVFEIDATNKSKSKRLVLLGKNFTDEKCSLLSPYENRCLNLS